MGSSTCMCCMCNTHTHTPQLGTLGNSPINEEKNKKMKPPGVGRVWLLKNCASICGYWHWNTKNICIFPSTCRKASVWLCFSREKTRFGVKRTADGANIWKGCLKHGIFWKCPQPSPKHSHLVTKAKKKNWVQKKIPCRVNTFHYSLLLRALKEKRSRRSKSGRQAEGKIASLQVLVTWQTAMLKSWMASPSN